MSRREDPALIEAEVARHPGLRLRREHRGKHDLLRLELNGRTARIFVSRSPSDYRAVRNTVARIRRSVKELRNA